MIQYLPIIAQRLAQVAPTATRFSPIIKQQNITNTTFGLLAVGAGAKALKESMTLLDARGHPLDVPYGDGEKPPGTIETLGILAAKKIADQNSNSIKHDNEKNSGIYRGGTRPQDRPKKSDGIPPGWDKTETVDVSAESKGPTILTRPLPVVGPSSTPPFGGGSSDDLNGRNEHVNIPVDIPSSSIMYSENSNRSEVDSSLQSTPKGQTNTNKPQDLNPSLKFSSNYDSTLKKQLEEVPYYKGSVSNEAELSRVLDKTRDYEKWIIHIEEGSPIDINKLNEKLALKGNPTLDDPEFMQEFGTGPVIYPDGKRSGWLAATSGHPTMLRSAGIIRGISEDQKGEWFVANHNHPAGYNMEAVPGPSNADMHSLPKGVNKFSISHVVYHPSKEPDTSRIASDPRIDQEQPITFTFEVNNSHSRGWSIESEAKGEAVPYKGPRSWAWIYKK